MLPTTLTLSGAVQGAGSFDPVAAHINSIYTLSAPSVVDGNGYPFYTNATGDAWIQWRDYTSYDWVIGQTNPLGATGQSIVLYETPTLQTQLTDGPSHYFEPYQGGTYGGTGPSLPSTVTVPTLAATALLAGTGGNVPTIRLTGF